MLTCGPTSLPISTGPQWVTLFPPCCMTGISGPRVRIPGKVYYSALSTPSPLHHWVLVVWHGGWGGSNSWLFARLRGLGWLLTGFCVDMTSMGSCPKHAAMFEFFLLFCRPFCLTFSACYCICTFFFMQLELFGFGSHFLKWLWNYLPVYFCRHFLFFWVMPLSPVFPKLAVVWETEIKEIMLGL